MIEVDGLHKTFATLAAVDDVSFSVENGTACMTSETNVITVTFSQNFGDVPVLVPHFVEDSTMEVVVYSKGATVEDSNEVLYTSVMGTKENALCSNRGFCDTSIGTCSCYDTNGDSYTTSNGYAGEGDRGDCGLPEGAVSSCPGEVACSGHGSCCGLDVDDDAVCSGGGAYYCECADGWTGGDCSERTCGMGRSWFSYPLADDLVHSARSECSDMGICDYSTGTCTCADGFFGAACEYMLCPGGTTNACSGHGECMSMSELALVAEDNGDATEYTYGADPNEPDTWDAQIIFGCHCDEGWTAYDCSLRLCPTGDDPGTYDQVNEIQALRCTATSGSLGCVEQIFL